MFTLKRIQQRGIMITYTKKLQSSCFSGGAYYYAIDLFLNSLIFAFLGMTSIHATSETTEIQSYVEINQHTVHEYEEAGDYSSALELARNQHEKSIDLGLNQEADNLSQIVKRMEEKLLTSGYSKLLFDENDQPRIKLLQLLELIGMEPLNPSESAISQINNWTQKHLLRRGERWEEQTTKFENLQQKIKPFLSELGFIHGSSAHFKDYEGAIVHGALLSRMRQRLHYLIEQWNRGVRFSHLYFLSGARPLEPQQENPVTFLQDEQSILKIKKDWIVPKKFPTTECELAEFLWTQSDIPEDMQKEVEVHFINAPMKIDPQSGKLLRPTTNDTIEAWLQTAPSHGRYLAITNAPYIHRQDVITRTIAPQEYTFDTIGSELSGQEKTAIIFDELARCIFQINSL